MAGLDMRGLADGFAQGFGLMNQYQRGQAADRRADEQLKIHRDNAAWQRQDGDRRFSLSKDQFAHSVTDSDRRFDLADRGFDLQERKTEHAMQTADRQIGLQQQGLSLQQSRFNAEQARYSQARQDVEDEQIINSAYALLAEGQIDSLTENHWEAFQRKPWLNPGHLASPGVGSAIPMGESVLDVNSPADLNQPEALNALNEMFMPEINVGDGGSKRIVSVIPSPREGHVALELEITRDDGSTYTAPMTVGRGTEEDAVVKEVPVEAIVNHFAGYRTMHNVLQSRPDIVDTYQRFAERMGIQSGVRRDTGMSQERLDDILDRYTKDQTAIISDDALIDSADRDARISELDSVYARNLGVNTQTLSIARQYAQSEGMPLSPQLLQAVQQEMGEQVSSEQATADNSASNGLSISEEAEQRTQQRQEARQSRERVNEMDGVLRDIERAMQPPPAYPGAGYRQATLSPEQRQAWRQTIAEMEASGSMTERQRARALRITEQLIQP